MTQAVVVVETASRAQAGESCLVARRPSEMTEAGSTSRDERHNGAAGGGASTLDSCQRTARDISRIEDARTECTLCRPKGLRQAEICARVRTVARWRAPSSRCHNGRRHQQRSARRSIEWCVCVCIARRRAGEGSTARTSEKHAMYVFLQTYFRPVFGAVKSTDRPKRDGAGTSTPRRSDQCDECRGIATCLTVPGGAALVSCGLGESARPRRRTRRSRVRMELRTTARGLPLCLERLSSN